MSKESCEARLCEWRGVNWHCVDLGLRPVAKCDMLKDEVKESVHAKRSGIPV